MKRPYFLYFHDENYKVPFLPFILDAEMRPVSLVNEFLRRGVSGDGYTSSPLTVRIYAYDSLNWLEFLHSISTPLTTVTNDTFVAYRNALARRKTKRAGKILPISKRTINGRISRNALIYEWAFNEGLIDINPVSYRYVKYARPGHTGVVVTERKVPLASYRTSRRREITYHSIETVMRFFNAINPETNWRDRLLVKLMFRLGMRRHEIARYEVDWLPSEAAVFDKRFAITGVPFLILGKNEKKRTGHILQADLREVWDYKKFERDAAIKRSGVRDHGKLFVSRRTGKNIDRVVINRMMLRNSERCGIEIAPHELRHSFAVVVKKFYRNRGEDWLPKLSYLLGHKQLSTTLDHYAHVADDMSPEDSCETHVQAFIREEIEKRG